MSITNKFSSLIDSGVRSRGRSYYHQGAVRIQEGDNEFVRAIVRGSTRYAVLLSIEGDIFSVSCTCPYFENDICKHIWATMLAAEAKGYLSGYAKEPSKLRMAGEDDEDSYDGVYDEDDEDEEVNYRHYTKTPQAQLPPWQRQQEQPSKAHWRQHIVAVANAMKNDKSYEAATWTSKHELFYIVDAAQAVAGSGLALELAFREQKING